MKTQLSRLAFVLIVLSVFCSTASAWNCTVPGQIRVQVPAGIKGNGPGNGDGQVDTVEGITFQCKTPDPTPTSTATSQKQKQQQSQNQNQSQSSSNKNSNANSNSNSNANSNTNNNASSAQANGNGVGNGNNSNNSTTNVEAPKIPVNTAVAPFVAPTVSCFKGFGAGVQLPMVGGSVGGGKIDENCAILETSRQAPSPLARCKVYITDKYAKKAGVTLEDCLQSPPVTFAPVQEALPVVPAPVPQITINVPAPVVQAPSIPVAAAPPATFTDLGGFQVNRSTSAGVCPSTRVALGNHGVTLLDRAVTLAQNRGEIILTGNVYTASVGANYLKKRTHAKISVHASDDQDGTVDVQVWN